MTTIAWDGRVLAADKQSELCGTRSRTTKIRRLSDGRLLGCAGYATSLLPMVDYLEGRTGRPARQDAAESASQLLEIGLDGSIRLHTQFGVSVLEVPFYAVGSGMDFALAAMHLGRNAEGAVLVAAEFDPATGHEVDTLVLGRGA